MDAGADAALRMALGNSRDDVIAELQARNRQLEQQNEEHVERQWNSYMDLAEATLHRANTHSEVFGAPPFLRAMPLHLAELIHLAGWGLNENATIMGQPHAAGRLNFRIVGQLETMILVELERMLRGPRWLYRNMQLTMELVAEVFSIPPGALRRLPRSTPLRR